MDRLIFTKTDGYQGYALFKRRNRFWLVYIDHIMYGKSCVVEKTKVKDARALIDPVSVKICRKLIEAYNRPIKGTAMLARGRGVRGNKTELKEIVCINPEIRRAISLKTDYIKDLETILKDHIIDWYTQV